MGVDFTACGEHRLELGSGCDPDLFVLHPDFGPAVAWTQDLLLPINPDYRDEGPAWDMGVGLRCLRLPGTFRLYFGNHLFLLGHIARWYTFLTDPEARSVLRRASRAVAEVLGSAEVFYLPDSAFAPSIAIDRVYDGGTMEAMRVDLMRTCGPPSLDLATIYPEEHDETMLENGYFHEALSGA
jgi:hypothetical protein